MYNCVYIAWLMGSHGIRGNSTRIGMMKIPKFSCFVAIIYRCSICFWNLREMLPIRGSLGRQAFFLNFFNLGDTKFGDGLNILT